MQQHISLGKDPVLGSECCMFCFVLLFCERKNSLLVCSNFVVMGKGKKKKKKNGKDQFKQIQTKRTLVVARGDPGKLLALSQRSVNPREVGSASTERSSLFSSKLRVLLVGEGDFSFAVSLTATIGGPSLVATSLDTRGEVLQKYGAEADQNIRALRAAGATVIHGVDATRRGVLDEALATASAFPHGAVSRMSDATRLESG